MQATSTTTISNSNQNSADLGKVEENVDNPQNATNAEKTKYQGGVSGELIIDSGTPTVALEEFLKLQNRFKNIK